jgi:hypothetical protein
LPTSGTIVTTDATQTLTSKSIVATQLTGTIADARMPDLTGDVTTVAGAVATTIVADAVTYAKMQNATANTVLVRDANSTGVISAKTVADTALLMTNMKFLL